MSALGLWGKRKVDSATHAATTKAAVVKKPKTFCTRTREECISNVNMGAGLHGMWQ